MPYAVTVKERIIRSVAIDENGCWRWQLSINNWGYARLGLNVGGKTTTTTAHRASYEVFRGDIPEDYDVDHLCRVRDCVNPDHLEAVTRSENLRRSALTGNKPGARKGRCAVGHSMSGDNVIRRTYSYGSRTYCRQCHLDRIKNCPTGRAKALKASAAA